ncbi:MAG: hypothetical protein LBU50_05225, partial [Cellulomonas sp.]|nr:hypothetical protein [Cellulomonas sp.]
LADRLRFAPRVAPTCAGQDDVVARRTAAQADESLAQVRPNAAVETQRYVLSLWLPLTDDFLALWWDTRVDGVAGRRWTAEHAQTARRLVARYDQALTVSPCRKYRDPKENLPVLVAAARARLDVEDGLVDDDTDRVVRHWQNRVTNVVDAMVAKRGAPGSARLVGLRQVQGAVAGTPGRVDLVRVARDRLASLPADQGIHDVATLLGPVTGTESDQAQARSDRFDVPAGTPMPPVVVRKVRLATAAPVEDLVAQGVVPSAEVLAELVPDLTARQVGASYDDPVLGRLMAQTYQAFGRRRSLLLLDLAHQVRFDELPWVAAVADRAVGRPDDPAAVGRRLAALAVDAFPATILPNPLISELSTLLHGLGLPLTEELAADIFMGEFSVKYLLAARQAATWLSGSLYQRYYDVPWDEVLAHHRSEARKNRVAGLVRLARRRPDPRWFADLCARDVPPGSSWSPDRNGMIIERQQQLTTHNLAVLLGPARAVPARPWLDLATDALDAMVRLLVLAQSQTCPQVTVKNAAYALRQGLVFLSRADSRADAASVTAVLDAITTRRGADRWPVAPVVDGIRHVAEGGAFSADGTCAGGGRRLVGWAVGPHWAVDPRASR